MKAAFLRAAAFAIAALLLAPAAAAAPRKGARRPAPPPPLVWHAETLDGKVVESRKADEAINPASVVKVATTWWALETLGPHHRYETRFFANGVGPTDDGVLDGDLVVEGSGDPDFHAENAFRVALALNEAGIRKVTGSLVVVGPFWMGWENGSAGNGGDAGARAVRMGTRLRAALDPARWTEATRRAWRATALGEEVPVARPPSVTIAGGVRANDALPKGTALLLSHRSKPLVSTLRRFNAFSNNDIERVPEATGSVREIESLLVSHVDGPVSLETASGLGTNRLTPRQIVSMLRAFRETSRDRGVEVEELLGVGGCDPGTVTRFFPRLAADANAGSLAAKTGTLTATDGGIAVVAGYLSTAEGEILFAVAAPRAGGRLVAARRAEEAWLLDLLARHGGPLRRPCSAPLGGPADGVEIVPPEHAREDRHATPHPASPRG